MIYTSLAFSEFRSQTLNIDFTDYEQCRTEMQMAAFKLSFEDLPQFLIQVVFLVSTQCGQNNESLLVHLSVLCSLLCSYFVFWWRIILYTYKHKHLYKYARKVDLVVSVNNIITYGYSQLKKIIRTAADVQCFRLLGTNSEYFECNDNSLNKVNGLMQALPMRNQLEFFEIDRCSIASAQEADILFRKFLLEESMMKNLRYLSIIRCNLSPNFLSRDLKSFLEKND